MLIHFYHIQIVFAEVPFFRSKGVFIPCMDFPPFFSRKKNQKIVFDQIHFSRGGDKDGR